MQRLLALSILFCSITLGCRERPQASRPDAATTNETAPAVVADADLANVLAELTQALRRFSAEKREVPATLDALAAAGYIRSVPQAPAGKVFAIDVKNVRVIAK